MRRTALGLGLALASCFNPTPPADRACGPGMSCPPGQECIEDVCRPPGFVSDARSDGDLCARWPSRLLDPCTLPHPSGALVIDSDSTFDSDGLSLAGSAADSSAFETQLVMIDGREVAVVAVGSLAVSSGATLRLLGRRPVIVAAWDGVDIAGEVTASSTAGVRGAGSNPSSYCALVVPDPGGDQTGGPGGSSAAAQGGAGGSGGGAPGPEAVPSERAPLHGGCDGSGVMNQAAMPIIMGMGGGAVALSSPSPITISGRLLAGGGGGAGGASDVFQQVAGGAGGGGGGDLIIETPQLELPGAVLAANGGGGGGGADSGGVKNDLVGPGLDGGAGATAASGGGGSSGQNRGGNGGALDVCPGDPGGAGVLQEDTGGGGGGACGLIEIFSASPMGLGDAVISPAPEIAAP